MKNLDAIRSAMHRYIKLSDEVWAGFRDHLEFQAVSKEEHLCQEGQVENYIYFLTTGVGRSYFLKDGKEFTYDFFFPVSSFTSFTSFITRQPAKIAIQMLSDGELYKIHHTFIYKLYDQYHDAERMGRLVAEQQFIHRSRKEMSFLSLTAEERYQELFERHPELVSKISVKHLSSYLGIHPESLSRIRKKVARRN